MVPTLSPALALVLLISVLPACESGDSTNAVREDASIAPQETGGTTTATDTGGSPAGHDAAADVADDDAIEFSIDGAGYDGEGVDGAGAGACPPCVAQLIAGCVPEGACVEDDVDPLLGRSDKCYGNGVMVSQFRYGGRQIISQRVVSKDGQPCYRLTSTSSDLYNIGGSLLLTDERTGRSVSGTYDLANGKLFICDGQAYVMGDACGRSTETCTPGACL